MKSYWSVLNFRAFKGIFIFTVYIKCCISTTIDLFKNRLQYDQYKGLSIVIYDTQHAAQWIDRQPDKRTKTDNVPWVRKWTLIAIKLAIKKRLNLLNRSARSILIANKTRPRFLQGRLIFHIGQTFSGEALNEKCAEGKK